MSKTLDFEIIISTCDKFSDLWDAHIHYLRKNWPDCPAKKIHLVTDAPTAKTFDGVNVVCAGEGTEITERLSKAFESVESDYILFTLDDYFLTEPINTSAILRSFAVMDDYNLDYMRLYSASKRYLKKDGGSFIKDAPGYFIRDISRGNYKISLYSGLWRADFMRNTLLQKLNAWQYEVALTAMAREQNARCAISNHDEFPILDVIRKGKLLRKANRYFKKDPVYVSTRPVMTFRAEAKLKIMDVLKRNLPRPVSNFLKKTLSKFGMTFYSPLE